VFGYDSLMAMSMETDRLSERSWRMIFLICFLAFIIGFLIALLATNNLHFHPHSGSITARMH
jgi:hypothetical protein